MSQVRLQPPHSHHIPNADGEVFVFYLELGDVADVLSASGRVLTHHADRAFVWFEQSEDHADQRGFAATVRSDETDKVILKHLKVDIFQYGVSFVACPKVLD